MLENLFNTALNGTCAKKKEITEVKELIISGKKIHSLEELKEHFDAESVLKALSNGSLLDFLQSHFYEREAAIISKHSLENKNSLKIICDTLGINYLKQSFILTPEVQQRLELIRQYTLDNTVLNNFKNVALNQEELATLLISGETTIYLCHGKFSIPLSKKGITYIGIDNPTIENAFTMQQYKNAGIIIKNINLPAIVNKEMSEYALSAAKKNGYDDYADNHSPLAAYFHNALKSYERFSYIRLPYSISAVSKRFTSEYIAKQELKDYLKKPYDTACAYVNTSNTKCIARTISEEYSKTIENCFTPIMENLKTLFSLKGKANVYSNLVSLVSNSRKTLLSTFSEEITENQEYYNMYDFNYFVERVSIEAHDYRVSEGFFKVMETLFADNIEYTYNDFYGAINEMEKDINDHVASFYKAAYHEYLSYVEQIENLFEELGTDYPPFRETENITDYLTRITLVELK